MAGKIAKAIGFPGMDDASSDDSGMGDSEPPDSMSEPKGNSAELLAMKQFERASGPEAKLQALRDLLEAMGVC